MLAEDSVSYETREHLCERQFERQRITRDTLAITTYMIVQCTSLAYMQRACTNQCVAIRASMHLTYITYAHERRAARCHTYHACVIHIFIHTMHMRQPRDRTYGRTSSLHARTSEILVITSIADRAIENLRERLAYVHATQGMGLDPAVLLQTQADAIVVMITNLTNMPMSATTQILTEVAGGPWTAAQQRAIHNAMARAQTPVAARAGGSGQQKCDKIENYLNDEMKSRIRDKTVSWEARREYIGDCLHRVGITVASEQILKRCAALQLLEGEQNIDAVPAQRKQSHGKTRAGSHEGETRVQALPAGP